MTIDAQLGAPLCCAPAYGVRKFFFSVRIYRRPPPQQAKIGLAGVPSLRRKEEGVSFPFPAFETAGYYQSSPAGTWDGVERMERTP